MRRQSIRMVIDITLHNFCCVFHFDRCDNSQLKSPMVIQAGNLLYLLLNMLTCNLESIFEH